MSVTVQVFDPAMCCSTGICGPSVDPQLIRFAADLEWLQSSGVSVERFNLAQQPKAFADSAAAKQALEAKGEAALPLILVDGTEKSSGTYPSREQLAEWAGVVCESEPLEATKASTGGCCGGSKASGDGSKKSKCC
jgi:hypothetical protein